MTQSFGSVEDLFAALGVSVQKTFHQPSYQEHWVDSDVQFPATVLVSAYPKTNRGPGLNLLIHTQDPESRTTEDLIDHDETAFVIVESREDGNALIGVIQRGLDAAFGPESGEAAPEDDGQRRWAISDEYAIGTRNGAASVHVSNDSGSYVRVETQWDEGADQDYYGPDAAVELNSVEKVDELIAALERAKALLWDGSDYDEYYD